MAKLTKVTISWVKHFWIGLLSSTIAFIAAALVVMMLGAGIVSALIYGESEPASVKDNSLLYLHLGGIMGEQQEDNTLAVILGTDDATLGLHDMIKAINIAKGNPKIKGIFLEGGIMSADPASLQELRKALQNFKQSGKKIYAYADNYIQGTYYICSVADKVVLNPVGTVDWHGLSSQIMFYKDLMEKLGVRMQVYKVGTYKSAVEPYTETQMSAANREQVTAFLDDIWHIYLNDVSISRNITPQRLDSLANDFMGLSRSAYIKQCGMVDTLMYKDEFTDMLKKKIGIDAEEKLNLVNPKTLCNLESQMVGDNKIAIYYAEGEVVDMPEMGLATGSTIVAPEMNKELQRLADDKTVKAVVIRVNSGGGSAYASEQIWHNIDKLAKKKPVVISMGGMAASGAYYLSAGADYIFAEPATLTGSIGIFGMIPDISELLTDKLSLKYDIVKTNALADFGNMGRPFNPEEEKRLQAYIDNGYSLFLKRVADSRKMTTAQVDSIAQGRVWTGKQAVRIGLVDKLGSLQDAVKYAAAKAKLGDKYTTIDLPLLKPWYAEFMLDSSAEKVYSKPLRAVLGELYEPLQIMQSLKNGCRVYARVPYIINIK